MGRNYSQTSLSQNILNNQLNNYKSQYKTLLSSRPVTNLIIEDSYSQYPIYNYQPMLYPKYINPLSQSLSLPKIHNNFISVLNYFRNYKDINEDLEDVNDDFGKDMIYNEKDEFSRFLVDFKDISIFWEVYKDFVEEYKKNIYIWAVYFCRLIKNKYAVYDPDLKYKKRKKRPPDRKMRY